MVKINRLWGVINKKIPPCGWVIAEEGVRRYEKG